MVKREFSSLPALGSLSSAVYICWRRNKVRNARMKVGMSSDFTNLGHRIIAWNLGNGEAKGDVCCLGLEMGWGGEGEALGVIPQAQQLCRTAGFAEKAGRSPGRV